LRKLYSIILANVDPKTLGKDDKTLLQECLQSYQLPLPTYNVTGTSGAAHNQQFEVECLIPNLNVAVKGEGASRRAAEQAAAKLALIAALKALPQALGKPKKTRSAKKKAAKKVVTEEQLNLKLKG
jgi:ribonuclease-3